jgi:hypothetical protein
MFWFSFLSILKRHFSADVCGHVIESAFIATRAKAAGRRAAALKWGLSDLSGLRTTSGAGQMTCR